MVAVCGCFMLGRDMRASSTLSSNRGGELFSIEFRAPGEYAHEPGFDSSIAVRGEHWDGEHCFPFSFVVEGVWLRAGDIVGLRDHIDGWLRRPLDQLVPKDLDAEFQLARVPGQSLRIRFGARADTISDRHPVVSISFSAGTFQGEFHFVTDQSCLSLFTEGLPTV